MSNAVNDFCVHNNNHTKSTQKNWKWGKANRKLIINIFSLSFRKGWETLTTVQLNGAIQMRRVKWVYVKIKQNILTNRIARPEGCYVSWCACVCARSFSSLFPLFILCARMPVYVSVCDTFFFDWKVIKFSKETQRKRNERKKEEKKKCDDKKTFWKTENYIGEKTSKINKTLTV